MPVVSGCGGPTAHGQRRLRKQVDALCCVQQSRGLPVDSSSELMGTGRSTGQRWALSTEELRSWHSDGFLICRNWWGADEISLLRRAMEADPKLAETSTSIAGALDFSVWFAAGPARSPRRRCTPRTPDRPRPVIID
eukprot:SAG11_NODE_7786_length_1096_cov_2.420261_2_plen_137_part_00